MNLEAPEHFEFFYQLMLRLDDDDDPGELLHVLEDFYMTVEYVAWTRLISNSK